MENTSEKSESTADWKDSYDNGYNTGYNTGYEYAYYGSDEAVDYYGCDLYSDYNKEGYDAGFNKGYDAGFKAGDIEKQKS